MTELEAPQSQGYQGLQPAPSLGQTRSTPLLRLCAALAWPDSGSPPLSGQIRGDPILSGSSFHLSRAGAHNDQNPESNEWGRGPYIFMPSFLFLSLCCVLHQPSTQNPVFYSCRFNSSVVAQVTKHKYMYTL